MSLPAPKINFHTYDKLVKDTEWLVQRFTTGYGSLFLKSPIWEPSEEEIKSFHVTLMTLDSSDRLPNEESNLVLISKIKDYYHLRIFAADKQKIVDAGKDEFFLNKSLRELLENEFRFAANQSLIDFQIKSHLLEHLAFPKDGRGLTIIGRDKNLHYHIRIFDWNGEKIVDKDEDSFKSDTQLLSLFKEVFEQSKNSIIDDQKKLKLLSQIQNSLSLKSELQWLPSENKADAGRALIRIVGRMAMMVTDRLNRVPEKHFLAFLNLIGAKQQPPRPARVPLTAYLVDNSPVDAIIPAHTQITALPQTGETEEVLFETEQDLVVVRSQLQAVIVHQGGQYCDQMLAATTETNSFPVFEIEKPNTIYIGADQLTTKSDSQEIQLAIANPQNLVKDWKWSYWDGETWQVLTSEAEDNKLLLTLSDPLSKTWKTPQSKVIEGKEAQWLRGIAPGDLPPLEPKLIRAEIKDVIPDRAFFNTEGIDLSKDFFPLGETPRFNDTFYIASSNILNFGGSEVTLHFEASSGIESKPSSNPAPSILWETWNGESWTPVFNNTGNNEAFYTSDWDIKTFKMPNQVAPVEVNGEENYWLRARLIKGNYGGDSQFEAVEYFLKIYKDNDQEKPFPKEDRGSINILKKGDKFYQVTFFDWNGSKIEDVNLDNDLKSELSNIFSSDDKALNSVAKSKLIQKILACLPNIPKPIFQYRSNSESGYFPPCLKSIKLSRSNISDITPKTKTTLKALSSGVFVCSDADISSVPNENGLNSFYLGFDRPFPNQVISLYLQVASPKPGDLQKATSSHPPVKLQWEYSVAEEIAEKKWRSLSVQDGTQNLSQRGMVQFIGPTDFASQTLFGRSAYWLRLRLVQGEFPIQPRLQRVLTNTVWAIQATTHQDEILGSGTGDPNLGLLTLHTPVLPGQQLLVREPELLPAYERDEIERLEGKDAIAVVTDASGQPEEIWVRWHEVSDFYGSGSRDRHYVLDRITGEIRFGGEGQGMAPPIGRNNIRMARYQSGGGSQGNRAAEALTDLKTTVPYVDRVINHESASGGADLESITAVQESAPKQLRHGDRAVTWQDIEDLTYAASSEVARVKVLTPPPFQPKDKTKTWIPVSMIKEEKRSLFTEVPELEKAVGQAGQVTVLIVPHSLVRQPTPSLALVEQVKRYLSDRMSPTFSLEITEPYWQEVTVTAKIVPVSLETANGLADRVSAALTDFLHPLTGGTKKRGWPFGRYPHLSDIYAFLERQSGVSYVTLLEISPTEDKIDEKIQQEIKEEIQQETENEVKQEIKRKKDQLLIYSGRHSIILDKQSH